MPDAFDRLVADMKRLEGRARRLLTRNGAATRPGTEAALERPGPRLFDGA